MSPQPFKVNQPAFAAGRVRQFLDLSTEYLRLVPLRRHTPAYFTDDDDEALDSLREALLAHMLMRKFITPGESVYIPRVLEHLANEYRHQLPDDLNRELRGNLHHVSGEVKKLADRGVEFLIDGTDAISGRTMLDSYLNGRLLHSDHDKWKRADSDSFRTMLGLWLGLRNDFRQQLKDARHNVHWIVTSHSLFDVPDIDVKME